MASKKAGGVRAAPNEKMIEVKVRFWTNDIAETRGEIIPKHGGTSGVVRMEANRSHGISPRNPRPFRSLMDLTAIIERVLLEHGIVLQTGDRMRKYVRDR